MTRKQVPDFLLQPLRAADGSLGAEIMRRLVPEALRTMHACVLATPETQASDVAGSQVLGNCVACGVGVWVAPSSMQLIGRCVFVCSACFEREAGPDYASIMISSLVMAAGN